MGWLRVAGLARTAANANGLVLGTVLCLLSALGLQGCGASAHGGGLLGGEAVIDWTDGVRFNGIVYDS